MTQFYGTGVALVTPFKADGSVDFDALKKLVNFQIDNGIDYLVVLGTTGEPATLTNDEKQKVIQTVIETNQGKLPLVIGIGGNNTQAVINEIQQADLSAFDAILSVSPYYNKPTQEGIYQHFKAIAQVSPKPLIIYNVPSRTGANMLPKTVLRLASDCSNIIGVKEAAGSMDQAFRLLQNKPEDFLVISGDDMVALPMTLTGGAGVISVIGQGIPNDFSKMIKLALDGKSKEASNLHFKIMDSIDYIFEEGNPTGIKALLKKRAICESFVRLPLVEASDELQEKISIFIDEY
ncbi:4-hydroxy-tetrahydrodipicolinate synthase [Aureibaculum sp. 2210JD6-5]|uniref:4-hydroxy-tetrahydrodipicolinate synthase n=1 Tax=Aureibaculum sp. 2210JD6-5 TaxID=3103957 RepID=UPI002AAC89A0|nr:4-hydroxy-tetrahydrodipicolinate synthase [Aureibaculum sp. 2210JD6-5]MDY7395475.1 4-hydroxy-tetrahydrodipicolinate synthase [Aureibaculum sp. 2210JD6-5]